LDDIFQIASCAQHQNIIWREDKPIDLPAGWHLGDKNKRLLVRHLSKTYEIEEALPSHYLNTH